MTLISTTVDGVFHEEDVEPRLLLVHYLRTRLGYQPVQVNSIMSMDHNVLVDRIVRRAQIGVAWQGQPGALSPSPGPRCGDG